MRLITPDLVYVKQVSEWERIIPTHITNGFRDFNIDFNVLPKVQGSYMREVQTRHKVTDGERTEDLRARGVRLGKGTYGM